VSVVRILYTAVRVISAVLAVAAVLMFLQALSTGEGGEMFAFIIAGLAWIVTALPLLVVAMIATRVIERRRQGGEDVSGES
jgi:hypothetical protein